MNSTRVTWTTMFGYSLKVPADICDFVELLLYLSQLWRIDKIRNFLGWLLGYGNCEVCGKNLWARKYNPHIGICCRENSYETVGTFFGVAPWSKNGGKK